MAVVRVRFFTEANMLNVSPVRYVAKRSLCKPNILHLQCMI